jgi:hypothetical protein
LKNGFSLFYLGVFGKGVDLDTVVDVKKKNVLYEKMKKWYGKVKNFIL